MGMLLIMQESAPMVHEHMSFSVTMRSTDNVLSSTNSESVVVEDDRINDVDRATVVKNESTGLPMLEIVDVDDDEKPSSMRWMPPPPKKKWMRHYLLGEPCTFNLTCGRLLP